MLLLNVLLIVHNCKQFFVKKIIRLFLTAQALDFALIKELMHNNYYLLRAQQNWSAKKQKIKLDLSFNFSTLNHAQCLTTISMAFSSPQEAFQKLIYLSIMGQMIRQLRGSRDPCPNLLLPLNIFGVSPFQKLIINKFFQETRGGTKIHSTQKVQISRRSRNTNFCKFLNHIVLFCKND